MHSQSQNRGVVSISMGSFIRLGVDAPEAGVDGYSEGLPSFRAVVDEPSVVGVGVFKHRVVTECGTAFGRLLAVGEYAVEAIPTEAEPMQAAVIKELADRGGGVEGPTLILNLNLVAGN